MAKLSTLFVSALFAALVLTTVRQPVANAGKIKMLKKIKKLKEILPLLMLLKKKKKIKVVPLPIPIPMK